MTQAHTFCLTRIQFADRSWQPHWAGLSTRLATTLTSRGANVWGAFSGLFGIASNELLLVTHGPGDDPRPNPALGEARLIEQYLLAPTARPGSPPPALTRPGPRSRIRTDIRPNPWGCSHPRIGRRRTGACCC
jgi:hypothetical protein